MLGKEEANGKRLSLTPFLILHSVCVLVFSLVANLSGYGYRLYPRHIAIITQDGPSRMERSVRALLTSVPARFAA